ncbi:hypothetical protein GLOIN_2v1775230 [Rhizophagus irregularis DAOM 181602=DAOM 197198]|nr:hypothetical protein GLOIN_2v1775230 [Rhizophagus irregularis DAOM 181602=DAOM 197198]
MINNRVTHGERLKYVSNKQSQQIQNKNKTNSKTNTGNTHLETTELAQRLKFTKGNLNNQKTKDSMYLDLHIAAHNIDGIASTPSIQKLHSLLEFIEDNNIDIMAISETNIDY